MSQPGFPNELVDSISHITTYFAREAKRLKDPSVERASRSLLLTYFTCLKQLGTIQHEIALETIAEQLKTVEGDARLSRSSIWKRLWKGLRRPSPRTDPLVKKTIRSASKLIRDKEIDPETKAILQRLIEDAGSVAALHKQDEILSGQSEDALLDFDVSIHWGTYTRLGFRRLVSFVGKHAFIILVPVLLAGIGYSWAVRQGQTLVMNAVSLGFWGILAVLLLPAMFKEYVIAKWLKGVRLRVERRLLLPVVDSVFQARLLGFMVATRERQTSSS